VDLYSALSWTQL